MKASRVTRISLIRVVLPKIKILHPTQSGNIKRTTGKSSDKVAVVVRSPSGVCPPHFHSSRKLGIDTRVNRHARRSYLHNFRRRQWRQEHLPDFLYFAHHRVARSHVRVVAKRKT